MNSSQTWLYKHSVLVNRYINHLINTDKFGFEDKDLLWKKFMKESKDAKSIMIDFQRTNKEKIQEIIDFLIYQEVIIVGVLASQRMGKDCLVCFLLEKLKEMLLDHVRIVTLGNFKRPPFVKEGDMFYSLTSCPVGNSNQRVIIYCSELDLFFPARDFKGGSENQTLNMQINTLAQNKQSLVGCAKLGANVDISYWRAVTMKLVKYISKENLKHDRIEFLSELAMQLRPSNPMDKSKVLATFQDKIITFDHTVPKWFDKEYSDQFHKIDPEKLREYARTLIESGVKPEQVRRTFAQTYRFKAPIEFYLATN